MRSPRVRRTPALAVMLCLSCAGPAAAQITAFVGGGALVPTESFSDVADVGWLVTAGLRRTAPGSRLALGIEGVYGRAAHGTTGERSELYGGGARLGYTLYEREPVSFEISAVVDGLVHAHKSESFPGLDSNRSGLAAGAGATLRTWVGSVRPFIQGSYVRGFGGLDSTAFPTRWAGVTVGVSVPLG